MSTYTNRPTGEQNLHVIIVRARIMGAAEVKPEGLDGLLRKVITRIIIIFIMLIVATSKPRQR